MSTGEDRINFTLAGMPELVGLSFKGGWLRVEKETIKEFDHSTYVNDDDAGYSFDDYPKDESGDFLMFEGLHTLGMLWALVDSSLHMEDESTTFLVYGFERVRFVTPVYADDRLRLHGEVLEVAPRNGGYLMRLACNVEIEDRDKPAYVAELLLLAYPKGSIDLSIPDGDN